MASAPARDRHHASLRVRDALAIIVGEGTCVTCLEPLGSALHRELREVSGG